MASFPCGMDSQAWAVTLLGPDSSILLVTSSTIAITIQLQGHSYPQSELPCENITNLQCIVVGVYCS